MEVKRSTLLHQNPKFAEEKAFFSRSSKVIGPKEKSKASKCYQQKVLVRNVDGRPLFPPKSSGCEQKPWPTKVSAVSVRGEELVKHMSNVPGYLQHVDQGGDVQEKALNFGVLDWQRLEKWKGDRRYLSVNEKAAVSPASSNGSSSFSMFESSSQSCRSSSSSYVAQSTQSPSLNHCQDSPTEGGHEGISTEQASSNSKQSYSPEMAYRRCPIRHRISHSGEKRPIVVNLAAKFEEAKQKAPEFFSFSDDVRPFSGANSSSGANSLKPRSKDSVTTNSVNRKMKKLEVVSDHRERRSGELRYKGPSSSVAIEDHSGFSEVNDGMSGNFQKGVHNSGRFSFESTESGHEIQTESGCMSSSGAFPSEDSQLTTFSPNVSHSCPFPCDGQIGSPDVNVCEGSDFSCDSTDLSPFSAAVTVVRSNGCQEKQDKSAKRPHNNYANKTSEKWDWNVLKPVSPGGREPLPNNHSSEDSSGMTRSSSLKQSSAMRQPKSTSFDRHTGDKGADLSRGRRSPLRRLLDPLLKPRAPSRACPPRLAAGSTNQPSSECKLPVNEELISTHGLHSFCNSSTKLSTDGACNRGSNSASQLPPENHSSVNEGKKETSTKQALLRLVWKNGTPLLTFSVNENDILAATRKKSTSAKQDCDYIYTFHYVHEIKKKTGGWISQGNKGNRKELVSRIVGQMNVSCLRRPRGHFAVREFNLFGPELRPTANEALEPVPCSELAAIVIRIPEESVRSSAGDMPQVSSCLDRSEARLMEDKCAYQTVERPGCQQNLQETEPPIVTILPSQVHGLSEGGKPSPLVQRWKSGGSCDCGGWDVGCSLSILTNRPEHRGHGAAQSCHNMDGTHRVELFIQGGDDEGRPIFSLVAFKEELYTVHFHASVASLQAFAICIALLHGRKHTGLGEFQDPQNCAPVEASPIKASARKEVGPSSMSTPYHPPLSPVGRA
ncbi:hypothetical protein Taro_028494 [Colocasia esculenta]|uniref:DUF3527 domain protein n=1 Tax=Colocasia esculenta TaxID=4460 RepID=A0A843VL87_COLES|nr:hypothetical protein [Colocasia esculenta]